MEDLNLPFPWKTLGRLAVALVRNQPLSFRAESLACLQQANGRVKFLGREFIPQSGPCLLTINHFTRPGVPAWWLSIAASAAVPMEIHWIATQGWTFNDRPALRFVTPITYWLFPRASALLGFSSMPPMPPDPKEVKARAAAVRKVIAYLRTDPQPVIGLAPEGQDTPEGALIQPPSGVGRFIHHITRRCPRIIPIGAYSEPGALCVRFGPEYRVDVPPRMSPDEVDQSVSRVVMQHIALLLPENLRGPFDGGFREVLSPEQFS